MAEKFAIFDEQGFPVAFYAEGVHEEIPVSAVRLSDSQWHDLVSNQGLRRWDGANVINFDPPARVITADDVNSERQRRILAGKVIDAVHVTGSAEDARNLMSLALGAQMRLAAGDTETFTTFRDGDNVDHELTPPQLLSLWQQSADYVSALYEASWALKAVEPIPRDFADDSHWPRAFEKGVKT